MHDRGKTIEDLKQLAKDDWILHFNDTDVKETAKAALALLKEQETTFEKDGHHIRCTSCGNYWCDTDREGNLFPHNYCPECGQAVKLDD